jgi:glycosyltransferase involved in cell wall biosynthesis
MKVTILYQYLQDAREPGHQLMLAFAQYLRSREEEIVVVAGEYGYMDPKKVRLAPWRRLIRREIADGVPVIRTYTLPYGHGSAFKRFFSYVSFSITCLLGLLAGPRPDVIYASTPPIFPMFSAWLASRLRRAPLIMEVRDLWPDSLVELGLVKNKILIRTMSWLERFLYNRVDGIVALTDGIRSDIVRRGWPAEKVHAISYGISPARFHADEAGRRRVRAASGWADQKIVAYVGAHGRANNLDVILRAARNLGHRADIRFVLIGDGLEKAQLMADAESMGLSNLVFHPPIAADDAPAYINAADLCVVTLQDVPLFAGAIPTKLIEYMACEKPVMLGVRGEAEDIVKNANAGVVFDPNDDTRLAVLVEELVDDPERRRVLGRNGSAYVRQNFLLERNQARLHELLVAATRSRAAIMGSDHDRLPSGS